MIVRRLLAGLIALVTAAIVVVPSASAIDGNLLVNSNFDQGRQNGVSQLFGAGIAPENWSISGTGGVGNDAFRSLGNSGRFGLYVFNFNGDGRDGTLAQAFEATPGQSYTVTFLGAKHLGADVTAQLRLQVLAGFTPIAETTVVVPDRETRFSFTFTATAQTLNLQLSDATGQGGGTYEIDVDDVEVIAGSVEQPNNLVANGHFKRGRSLGPGSQAEDWSFSGQGGRDDAANRLGNGEIYYAMDGWGNARDGVIEQTLPTEAGRQYTVSFLTAKFRGADTTARLRVEAVSGGAVLDETATIPTNPTRLSYDFTATGSNTTLRLSDATSPGGENYDIDLDDIVVSESSPTSPPDISLTTSAPIELIGDGGFEAFSVAHRKAKSRPSDSWSSSQSDNKLRIWDGDRKGMTPAEGQQYAELNRLDGHTISQILAVEPGATYEFSFQSRSRKGASTIEVLVDNQTVTAVEAPLNEWATTTGTFTATASSVVFALRSNAAGTFVGIDTVSVKRIG